MRNVILFGILLSPPWRWPQNGGNKSAITM